MYLCHLAVLKIKQDKVCGPVNDILSVLHMSCLPSSSSSGETTARFFHSVTELTQQEHMEHPGMAWALFSLSKQNKQLLWSWFQSGRLET
jgi:hypothetical protein